MSILPALPAVPGAAPLATMADFERLRQELLAALQAPPPDHQAVPFDSFREKLLALYKPPLRSKATFRAMGRVLGFLADLGVKTTADLTTATIAAFVQSRPAGESPNTTFTHLAYVRAACNWAAGEGYVRISPFAQRKRWIKRLSPKVPRIHSREEIARVLELAERDTRCKQGWAQWRARRLYVLTAILAYTGLRRNEALYLRVEDVLLEERMILVQSHRQRGTKTEASAQPVPMPAALVEIVRGWLPYLAVPDDIDTTEVPLPAANPDGKPDPSWLIPNSTRTGPWIGGSAGHKPIDRLKALGARAGVPEMTFQSWRHSWATHAEYWGLSDAQIQRVLRHTNTRTQWHYRHAEANNLRAMVEKISFGHEPAGELSALPSADACAGNTRPLAPAVVRAANGPKLDDADAAEMRRLRGAGWTLKALQERFHVSKSTVHYTLAEVIHKAAGDVGQGNES